MANIGDIVKKQRTEGIASEHAKAKEKKKAETQAKSQTHKSTITEATAPKVETPKEEPNIFQRALDTVSSAAKSTGSQAAEIGGLALSGIAGINRKKSAAAQA